MSNYTPLYPPQNSINGIDPAGFPFLVLPDFIREYIQTAPLVSAFGGKEMTRPIYIHTVQQHEGTQFRVPMLDAMDYTNPAMDFNQVSDYGQTPNVNLCPVDIHNYSFDVKLKGMEVMKFATPIDLPPQVKPLLMDAVSRSLVKMILDSATFDPLDRQKQFTPYQDLVNKKPSYDRVAFGGFETDRATYNSFTGIKEALNNLNTGPDWDENGVSTNLLLRLREMAIEGGNKDGAVLVNNTIENQIRPAFIRTKAGFPDNKYLFLASPRAMRSLLNDPTYIATTSGRGTVVSEEQPQAVSGAHYRGSYEGIMLYEVNELGKYSVVSANDEVEASWCMLVGGGAWALGWAQNPWIVTKDDYVNMTREFASHETRGHRSLVYPSRQRQATGAGVPYVEQGIIHAFVRTNKPT